MKRKDEIRKLIETNSRRLQKLKEKQAFLGVSTPPEFLMEIEDIEAGIEKLQTELDVEAKSSLQIDTAKSGSISEHFQKRKHSYHQGQTIEPEYSVVCPFCFEYNIFTSSSTCPACSQVLPIAYLKDCLETQPLWIAAIGYPNHGKTTYLAVWMWVLESITAKWGKGHVRFQDENTYPTLMRIRRDILRGREQFSSLISNGISRPFFLKVRDPFGIAAHNLVLYDVPGQVFNCPDELNKYSRLIAAMKNVWLVISLGDLDYSEPGKTIADLFETYLSVATKEKSDLRDCNLIVIFSKADQMSFTPRIEKYLRTDPFQEVTLPDLYYPTPEEFSLQEYISNLREVSIWLQNFTAERISDGTAFINLTKSQKLKLVFTTCSLVSLRRNKSVSDKHQFDTARRHRILDPFLWTLIFNDPGFDITKQ